MKILITGASGLVGRNLSFYLSDKHELLTPSHRDLDLLDFDKVFKFMEANKPDLIIHCAGIVGGIKANMSEPVKFLIENVDMGRNVVWAARKSGVKKMINLGSSCMYPRNEQNALSEDMILSGELEPTNEGYALAKIFTQRLCSYINREDASFQYKTIIPCNLYGEWDKFDLDKAHMVSAVIRKIHDAVQNGDDEVIIWGTGKVRREFMYIGDLADFIDYAIDNFKDCPDLLNVGLGYDYTIEEYYKVIGEMLNFQGQFIYDKSKPEGMRRKLVDVSRLSEFGWKSKTSLKDGIKKAYEFYLNNEC